MVRKVKNIVKAGHFVFYLKFQYAREHSYVELILSYQMHANPQGILTA